MDSGFKSAIRTAQAFKSNSQQDSVLPFIKALHRECAVDEPIMCTVQEMLFGSIAIVEYAHDDLPRLIEIGVNYGRDNDTIASIAAAFGGAAAGVDALSDEWQQTVKTANPQYNFAETASRLAQL
ncbi:MAG: ADP-ribosylglycohydrolase family protein [candidate division KSB1 bacterium]|nr:ADP-ribosylglycohydrolase family protein [candidate division KSB1 bacterium]